MNSSSSSTPVTTLARPSFVGLYRTSEAFGVGESAGCDRATADAPISVSSATTAMTTMIARRIVTTVATSSVTAIAAASKPVSHPM